MHIWQIADKCIGSELCIFTMFCNGRMEGGRGGGKLADSEHSRTNLSLHGTPRDYIYTDRPTLPYNPQSIGCLIVKFDATWYGARYSNILVNKA